MFRSGKPERRAAFAAQGKGRGGKAEKPGLSGEQTPILIARDRYSRYLDAVLPNHSEDAVGTVFEDPVWVGTAMRGFSFLGSFTSGTYNSLYGQLIGTVFWSDEYCYDGTTEYGFSHDFLTNYNASTVNYPMNSPKGISSPLNRVLYITFIRNISLDKTRHIPQFCCQCLPCPSIQIQHDNLHPSLR